jgi:translation elongation factor EF-Tu-like GTPase
MIRLYNHSETFEAEITILTEAQGGRKSPPHNGIRWDFKYVEDSSNNVIYMIWPEFVDDQGDAIDRDLFLEGTLKARMHVVVEDMLPFHLSRLSVGTRFYCVEGPHTVAHGVVTKITDSTT